MYTEIRQCMTVDFPEDFGPEIVQEPGKELQDMGTARNTCLSAILVVLYLATTQLPPSAPNWIIAIALGTRLCMLRGAIFCPLQKGDPVLRGSPSLHVNRP